MKKLDIDTWRNVFENTNNNNDEVEVVCLNNIEKTREFGLATDCELLEDGFETELEAHQRTNKRIWNGDSRVNERSILKGDEGFDDDETNWSF